MKINIEFDTATDKRDMIDAVLGALISEKLATVTPIENKPTRTVDRVKAAQKPAPAPKPAPEPEPEETEPEEVEAEQEDADEDLMGGTGETLDDAIAIASQLIENGEQPKVKAALAKVGARKVSELAGAKIGEFIRAIG